MWKIGVGYSLLLVWVYVRAELDRRRTAHAPASSAPAPAHPISPPLRLASWTLLVAAVAFVAWGSGWNVLFWLPAGFALTGLIQTLLPLRNEWR